MARIFEGGRGANAHLALGEGFDNEAHVVGEEEKRPALAGRACSITTSKRMHEARRRGLDDVARVV
jgi:hypothetical protein